MSFPEEPSGEILGAGVPCILFKTPAEPPASDLYDTTLRPDYAPYFVPVLSEQYHLDEMIACLRARDTWEGVIITSRRGAEAWIKAAERAQHDSGEAPVDWSEIPLWSVGTASVDAFREASQASRVDRRQLPSTSPDRVAKSAKVLVPLLLAAPSQTQKLSQGGTFRQYLVVRGDKSLEEIPAALRDQGRRVVEMTVYSTTSRSDVAKNIDSTIQTIAPDTRLWLGFFSPSSASFALDHLSTDILRRDGTKVFAIGDTTRHYLEEERGIEVHAVADQPSAKGMLAALRRADGHEP